MTKLNRPVAEIGIAELKAAAVQVDMAVKESRSAIIALGDEREPSWVTIGQLRDKHPAVIRHMENLRDKMEIADRLQSMYGAKTWNEWIALLMAEPVPPVSADNDAMAF